MKGGPRAWVLALASVGLLALLTLSAAAETVVYRSHDREGTIVLGDRPPGSPGSGERRAVRARDAGNPSGPSPGSGPTFTVVPAEESSRSPLLGGEDGRVRYDAYPVRGEDAASAIAMALEVGPLDEGEDRRYPGQTRWSLGWTYDYSYRVSPGEPDGWRVTANVGAVRVTRSVTVILPRPEDTGGWNDLDWTHWDVYLRGLRDHEEAHVRLVYDPQVERGMISDMAGVYEFEWPASPHPPARGEIRAAVEEEVYAIGRRWIDLVKDRNEQFDRTSRHGLDPAAGSAYFAALGIF